MRSLPFNSKECKQARGAGAMMEMILILPVLVMLSLGMVDYGYYMFLKNTFQGAAQAGARAAAPATATNSNLTGGSGIITTMLNAAGISSSNYTVTLSPTDISTATAGSTVTVTITASWGTVGTHMLGSAYGGISNSKQITTAAAMVKESS